MHCHSSHALALVRAHREAVVYQVWMSLELCSTHSTRQFILVFERETIEAYEAALASIASTYPLAIHPRTQREETLSDHLRKIHPTSWTVFGNSEHIVAKLEYLRSGWPLHKAYGRPTPLFGIRTTSAAEGENNGLLWCLARVRSPPLVLVAFIERSISLLEKKCARLQSWIDAGATVAPYAKARFD